MPARVALQGRIHHSFPCTMRVFLVWKRRYADVRAGTQAPPLRILLGWIACGWFCLLVGEDGAHEPTPSVLYFCQPRVADDRRLPWVKSWRGTYAIGIVLFKINFRVGKSFAACGNVVMMCDEKKYNPQGGSLLPYIITQGRLRCTCQPCAIESITPMG